MSFGIALSGGGARGAAHVGVLLALEQAGLRPRAVAGTSSGGIVAGLYAAGVTPQQMREIMLELEETGSCYLDADLAGILGAVPKFLFARRIGLSGLIKGNRMERVFYELTGGKPMTEARMRTVIPAVDLNSGETVAYTDSLAGRLAVSGVRWETGALLSEAMRASSAFPVVFRPKELGGRCLVDGGVTDTLPVDLLIAAGERNVLAVDIGQAYEMPKDKNLLEISTHSLAIMEERLKECRSEGEKLLLKPRLPENVGLLTLRGMSKCMQAGYSCVKERITEIRSVFR